MVEANQAGDRATLKADSFMPLGMALIYLLLLLYFKGIGGYRALKVEEQRWITLNLHEPPTVSFRAITG
jgi:hypothetical protein